MNIGNGYHYERLHRFPEPEENVPVFGFVGRSGNTDDVYINARAIYDVHDDPYQYGHSRSSSFGHTH